jgi:hypothetical protein
LGQEAVADLVWSDLMKIVACGLGLAGLRKRPQTVCTVTLREVVEPRLGS